MNTNQPNPLPGGDDPNLNEAVMNSLRMHRWIGRGLVAAALAFGLLSILASVAVNWAAVYAVHPMQELLLQDYPQSVQQSGTNAEGKAPLSREELNWRHVQVTAAQGKMAALTALATTLSGVGTFVVLVLVIFNRRVTLRQVNASLSHISEQIKQLQDKDRR